MKKPKLRITTEAYHQIVQKIGSKTPEQGGILLGTDGIITDFIFDKEAKTTGSTYSLNVDYLNPIIREFKTKGKELLGIIHSHPFGYSKLSDPDRDYFSGIFKSTPDLDYLFTPIVFSAKQEEFHIFPYCFYKDGTVEEIELEILPNDYAEYIQKNDKAVSEIPSEADSKTSPDAQSKVVENSRRMLVVIHNQTQPKEQELPNAPKMTPKEILIGMGMSGIYFFILGLCTGIFPIAFLYIIKNIFKS